MRPPNPRTEWGMTFYLCAAMMASAVPLGVVLALRTGNSPDWTMATLAVALSGVLWLLGRVLRST